AYECLNLESLPTEEQKEQWSKSLVQALENIRYYHRLDESDVFIEIEI
ncbi:unnamed protein product, partial [Rotaria sp. Silwood2]